jgi:hypothetical protein
VNNATILRNCVTVLKISCFIFAPSHSSNIIPDHEKGKNFENIAWDSYFSAINKNFDSSLC